MIRKAEKTDLDQIFHLYRENALDISRIDDLSYAAKAQADGFVVALEGREEVEKRIERNFLFHVYEEDNEIQGFIIINKEIYFPKGEDNIIWFDHTIKSNYFTGKDSITLHEIIVTRDYRERGIGKQLLESTSTALRENGYKHLFSIVTFAPVTNMPSVIFHTKNGFERACVTMPFDLFGMKNYMSVLFHKGIK